MQQVILIVTTDHLINLYTQEQDSAASQSQLLRSSPTSIISNRLPIDTRLRHRETLEIRLLQLLRIEEAVVVIREIAHVRHILDIHSLTRRVLRT